MIVSHTLMAQVLSAFTLHPWSSTWRTLLDSSLHFLLLPIPPVCLRLPLPPRAVPSAPLHEGHDKLALLRCRREWRHPKRLYLSHNKEKSLTTDSLERQYWLHDIWVILENAWTPWRRASLFWTAACQDHEIRQDEHPKFVTVNVNKGVRRRKSKKEIPVL